MEGQKSAQPDAGRAHIPRQGNTLRLFLIAFGILLLLLIAVLATQYSTGSTIQHLRESNSETSRTLRLSNALEELVGDFYGIDLQVRQFLQQDKKNELLPALQEDSKDLRDRLRTWLWEINTLEPPPKGAESLVQRIYGQLNTLDSIMQYAGDINNRMFTPDENIYAEALAMQTRLEERLSSNMKANNALIGKILRLSRILSIISILAVAILGTVLIRRLYLNQLLVKDLQAANNKAIEMARRQDQFVANISHEIRTPVNAISGFGRLLASSRLRPDQQEYADMIQDAARLLLTLVSDLLDAAKLKENKLQLNPRPFRFREICQLNEKMFKRLASEKGIALSCGFDPAIPEYLFGDPDRFQQVMVNLISNSIRFTPQGSVTVSLTLESIREDNAWLKLEVADTGIGIAAEDQERIFERFEQARNDEYPVAGGTGLGLNIVKNLVEYQGGSIGVKSAVGKGAIFTVRMPFGLAEKHTDAKTEAAAREKPDTGRISYAGAKVLVAEDNKVNQLLLRHILAEFDILPDVVDNGKQAVDFLEKNPDTELVLMDIQMPEMRGDEAARAIRIQLGLDVPIVAISAFDRQTALQQTGGWQPDGFVPKPLQPADVANMLHTFLSRKQGQNIGHIDKEWMLQNYGAQEDFTRQLLQMVRTQLPEEIQLLQQAIQDRNADEAAKTGHSLTATAASISPEGPLTGLIKKIREQLHATPPDWAVIDITMKMAACEAEETIAAINRKTGNPV